MNKAKSFIREHVLIEDGLIISSLFRTGIKKSMHPHRDAGGVTDFEAIITYPDTETQIPSSYQYTYTLMGNEIIDTFDNVNPDEGNESLDLTDSESSEQTSSNTSGDVSSVDTNGNGQVTIKGAKAAGFSIPITSDHWLYKYMDDRDGDGLVGE